MVTTNIAGCHLPHIADNLTKTVTFKERASFAFAEDKMGITVTADAFSYFLAEGCFKIFIKVESFFVYINLPADATAVFALIRNAMKFFIVIGYEYIHFNLSLP